MTEKGGGDGERERAAEKGSGVTEKGRRVGGPGVGGEGEAMERAGRMPVSD